MINQPLANYPVVRRERAKERARGIHIPYEKWGAVWSYLEFPNHLVVRIILGYPMLVVGEWLVNG